MRCRIADRVRLHERGPARVPPAADPGARRRAHRGAAAAAAGARGLPQRRQVPAAVRARGALRLLDPDPRLPDLDHRRDLRRGDRPRLPADDAARAERPDAPPPGGRHMPALSSPASTSPSHLDASRHALARADRLPPDGPAARRALGRQHREHARAAGRPVARVLLLHRRLAHAHDALRPHRRAAGVRARAGARLARRRHRSRAGHDLPPVRHPRGRRDDAAARA